MIIVDKEGIEAAIKRLSRKVNGNCYEAGMYIGRLCSGKVVKLVVMDKDEAENENEIRVAAGYEPLEDSQIEGMREDNAPAAEDMPDGDAV